MNKKFCSFCNTEHELTKKFWDMYKNSFKCKQKRKYYFKLRQERNPELKKKAAERSSTYYYKNREEIKLKSKKYREKNKDRLNKWFRDHHKKPEIRKKRIERYRSEEYKKRRNKILAEKRKTDPSYFLPQNCRGRIRRAIKPGRKNRKSNELIGCNWEFLRKHLESQFKAGMSWENYGKWHIDHIIPLSSFDLSKEEEQMKACHYSNLQPLWAEENLRKSNKILK